MLDDVAIVDVQAFAARDFQTAGVQTEEMVDRGVQVSDVVGMFDRMEAEFVGGSVNSRLDAGSRHPDRKSVRMMIATGSRFVELTEFDTRGATEFRREDD